MKRQIPFLISLLFLFATSTAQTPKTLLPAKPELAGMSPDRLKRIDTNIEGWIADGRTNGAVALIVRDGKIVYHKAFGYDDPQKTKPMRTDHIFRIASQTKAITSVAAMILYEEGKFLLDDPISRYLPNLPNL